jgi:hypothetical protein
MANFLSGMMKKSLPKVFFLMSAVSSFSIENLFSVSGSSSVAIIISENSSTTDHIIGLLDLSLKPGAQKTVINLFVHLMLERYCSVFSNASGECAKSTKQWTPFFSMRSILPVTHTTFWTEVIAASMLTPICTATLSAAKILYTLKLQSKRDATG